MSTLASVISVVALRVETPVASTLSGPVVWVIAPALASTPSVPVAFTLPRVIALASTRPMFAPSALTLPVKLLSTLASVISVVALRVTVPAPAVWVIAPVWLMPTALSSSVPVLSAIPLTPSTVPTLKLPLLWKFKDPSRLAARMPMSFPAFSMLNVPPEVLPSRSPLAATTPVSVVVTPEFVIARSERFVSFASVALMDPVTSPVPVNTTVSLTKPPVRTSAKPLNAIPRTFPALLPEMLQMSTPAVPTNLSVPPPPTSTSSPS